MTPWRSPSRMHQVPSELELLEAAKNKKSSKKTNKKKK